MQLVKDGKLSPDDAAELMEAFADAPDEDEQDDEAVAEEVEMDGGATEVGDEVEGETFEDVTGDVPPKQDTNSKGDDLFSKLIGSIEKLGKDVTENVDWKEVSGQVREGVGKGIDAIKAAAEGASKGKGPFGSVFGVQERKRVELPLAVPKGKVLRIDASDGDISIEGGHDVGSVTIDAAFRAYNDEEAKKQADAYLPVLEENDEEIVLRQMDPTGVVADLTIVLPKGVPIRIKNTNGDISVSGTKASVKIQNAKGDIKVTGADGMVSISTSKGTTKVVDTVAKNIDVESKSGDIVLERTEGPCSLKTSSGDIFAYECSARTIAAEAASGDITLDMSVPVEGSYNIRTVTGDIRLELPDGNDVRVHLSTLRGDVNCHFELEDETRDNMKVTGRLGDGTGMIDISAVNGDVTMGLRDATAPDSGQ